nr:efflux RND transporter periplasmic adaptor subunit [bacterium]
IEPNPLVLFEPQLKNAESALNSAKAAVTQAEVNLSRTVIKAPFNCRVRSKNIDIGQYVKSGDRVAEFAGTDSAEIMVAIPQHELQWMSIPGSHATISLETGSELSTWTGRIVRSTGEVDPGTRMISVVIEVNDPYTLSSSRAGSLNLAAGSFVHVNIKGTELKDIYRIPRIALRDDNTVWLMDQDNKLKIKSVKVLRREKEDILVRNSLTDGEKIVLTNISGAANGMKLRDLN